MKKENWLKRNLPEVAGTIGFAAGCAAFPKIVAAAGSGSSCAGLTEGLATIGNGSMRRGLAVGEMIPGICALSCYAIGHLIQQSLME